jgi:endonuclease/exonuclease/phosphatase (EEP) superfamily protein YafD
MLGYLLLGLLFLILGRKRLLFTSFLCCGALCLFLKQSSNSHLRLPEQTQNEKITIAHFNTSSAPSGYNSLLEAVIESDADIISFQEVTPDWDLFLKNNLSETYPFNGSNVRIDPYGMSVFSKIPINQYDTFHYEEIPHQMINISISEKQNINIVSAHVLPPVGQRLNERAVHHLDEIANEIGSKDGPSIVLGDFNLVYWSNEIRNFREKTQLKNSRRDVSQNLLKIPYDHIFFSGELECTKFQDISDTISNHLGIIGTYQIREMIPIKESRLPSLLKK